MEIKIGFIVAIFCHYFTFALSYPSYPSHFPGAVTDDDYDYPLSEDTFHDLPQSPRSRYDPPQSPRSRYDLPQSPQRQYFNPRVLVLIPSLGNERINVDETITPEEAFDFSRSAAGYRRHSYPDYRNFRGNLNSELNSLISRLRSPKMYPNLETYEDTFIAPASDSDSPNPDPESDHEVKPLALNFFRSTAGFEGTSLARLKSTDDVDGFIIIVPSKCPVGYSRDHNGICRQVFGSISSNGFPIIKPNLPITPPKRKLTSPIREESNAEKDADMKRVGSLDETNTEEPEQETSTTTLENLHY